MKIQYLLAVAAATVLALAGCSGGSSNSNNPASNTTSQSSSPLIQSQVYAQEKTDVATLNQAVQQYHAAEGRNPGNLEQLVPTYIARIPQAPPGYKFNYDPNGGTVSVARQ